MLSRRDKDILRLGEDLVSEVSAEEARGVQVDGSAEDGGEFVLHGEEREAGGGAGLELDEDVDVAVGAEVIAEHGAEESEAPDAVAAAEVGEGLARDGDT